MKNRTILVRIFFLLCLSNFAHAQDPLFPNSVVSNDIDFILDTDPDVFESLAYIGLADKEMPDSRTEELFDEDTFIFEASFTTGTTIEIWCHSDFLELAAAQEYAEKLCPRLGKLPVIHRSPISHVVVHKGDAGAFAEIEGNFFVLYSDNMDDRISTHDLEETVFHEAVHASIQEMYASDPSWTGAQDADNAFVTEYGESLPDLEDMPESALFAYTLLEHPGRLSPEIENWLVTYIPNRLEFFCNIYSNCSLNIGEEIPKNEISVYPNPNSGQFSVSLDVVEKDSFIKIYSLTGQLMKSIIAQKGQNEVEIDDLSSGIYFVQVPGFEMVKFIKD